MSGNRYGSDGDRRELCWPERNCHMQQYCRVFNFIGDESPYYYEWSCAGFCHGPCTGVILALASMHKKTL